jgi:TatA/E family protein of Tat protein translocase
MFRFGVGELSLVLLIVLLLFGGKKLPEIAKAMGKSIKEFKNAGKEIRDSVEEATGENSDVT